MSVYIYPTVGRNDGETGDSDEPFVCDICMETVVKMYELGGIQVCRECYRKALRQTLKECLTT
jgi:hypothetical protein